MQGNDSKHRRAIAPIIATIVLVAITVVGGISVLIFAQGFFNNSSNIEAAGHSVIQDAVAYLSEDPEEESQSEEEENEDEEADDNNEDENANNNGNGNGNSGNNNGNNGNGNNGNNGNGNDQCVQVGSQCNH